jgi:hypothetical protein
MNFANIVIKGFFHMNTRYLNNVEVISGKTKMQKNLKEIVNF